jgi:hypothetical protein
VPQGVRGYAYAYEISADKSKFSIEEFSKRHDESIYFDSDEEMEGWFESFMEEFGKPFIYID